MHTIFEEVDFEGVLRARKCSWTAPAHSFHLSRNSRGVLQPTLLEHTRQWMKRASSPGNSNCILSSFTFKATNKKIWMRGLSISVVLLLLSPGTVRHTQRDLFWGMFHLAVRPSVRLTSSYAMVVHQQPWKVSNRRSEPLPVSFSVCLCSVIFLAINLRLSLERTTLRIYQYQWTEKVLWLSG